ncbi:MAG: hypothetical protein ACLP8A_17945 [Methylovirgula sp.]
MAAADTAVAAAEAADTAAVEAADMAVVEAAVGAAAVAGAGAVAACPGAAAATAEHEQFQIIIYIKLSWPHVAVMGVFYLPLSRDIEVSR